MTTDSPTRTRYIDRGLAPGSWWQVEDVALSADGLVYYRLGPRIERPVDRRDEGGRTALEAFAGLPFDAMLQRLEAYRAALVERQAPEWDAIEAARAIDEFAMFVTTFGPVGIEWGATFRVNNPEVERMERALEQRRTAATPVDAPTPRSRRLGTRFWTVSFWGHGPGRDATPTVRPSETFPGRSWSERIRLADKGLHYDLWPRIAEEQRDLRATLDLAEAIARADQFECRRALQPFQMGDDVEYDLGGPGRAGDDLGSIVQGMQPRDRRIKPFQGRAHDVDWVQFGRITLAWLITRKIDFATPFVDVNNEGVLRVKWRATSLLELIYLELMNHVTGRPDFGIASCERCGGPILRTRHSGGTGNRWHPGCQGGRVARWRGHLESGVPGRHGD